MGSIRRVDLESLADTLNYAVLSVYGLTATVGADVLATSKLSESSCLTVPSWIDWFKKSMIDSTRRCLFDMMLEARKHTTQAYAIQSQGA